MDITIPSATVYSVREKDAGLVVYALQKALNHFAMPDHKIATDGTFGKSTTWATRFFQGTFFMEVDGVAGPATSAQLCELLCAEQEVNHELPDKILLSKVRYESSETLGAVNWSKAGGVDCCFTQRRVVEADYHNAPVVERAWDPPYQAELSGSRVRELHDLNLKFGSKIRRDETAWRVAVLAHNYPTLADQIRRVGFKGLSSYYTTPQDWTIFYDKNGRPFRLKFPDGHEVATPLEWGQRYALGNPGHNEPGQAVKLVEFG